MLHDMHQHRVFVRDVGHITGGYVEDMERARIS
jgi:hypothetical protein